MQAVDERDPKWTDFARYPHEDLIRALSVSNPNELLAAGDAWAQAATALYERAEDVSGPGAAPAAGWSGAAAENHRVMLAELAEGIRRVGGTAAAARDLLYAAAEALAAAWASMPAVSGEAARRQAVLIMAELAERYLEVTGELNEAMSRLLPDATDRRAGRAPSAELIFGDPAAGGAAGGSPAAGSEPLFGRMLTAGLAAAGAVLGRPFVPSLLNPRKPATPLEETAPGPAECGPEDAGLDDSGPDDGAPDDSGPGGGAGGLGGGGLGGGGLGGGGLGGGGFGGGGAALPPMPELDVPELDVPDPVTEPAGPAEPAGIAAATGGGPGPSGDGLRAVPPMMPMMPMGLTGDGGGTGRRLPPWLVETENVWGEATVVTAPVIGEDVAGGTWW